MKPEVAKQLQDILDIREQKKHAASKELAELHKKDAKSLADFAAKKEKVIRPALQEIVDLYKIGGITLRIADETERPKDARAVVAPYIRLDMAGVYPTHRDMKPEFKITFEKRTRTLSLFTATQTSAGHAGDISLDTVTADWIQTAFLKYEANASR